MLIDRLISQIIAKQAPIVVGLDPRLELIPKNILDEARRKYDHRAEAAAYGIFMFNVGIIDAIADLVPAVKPQIAFYELLGIHGIRCYNRTCEYAKQKGLIVIADAKRGDIGSTSKAYADAYLGKSYVLSDGYEAFYSDFLTVNPYLGTDGLDPFVEVADKNDKGIFALVKTSNQSAAQIQDLMVGDQTVYQKVGQIIEDYASSRVGEYGYAGIGAVVGATYPEQAAKLREEMPSTFFLVPGYGAQGAAGDDITTSFDKHGLGAIVNSSRGITYAYKKEQYDDDFREAARQAVLAMKADINQALQRAGKWYGDLSNHQLKRPTE